MFVCDCPDCGRHFEISVKTTSASMPTITCVCGYVFMKSAHKPPGTLFDCATQGK
jgi:hypothetical protein